MNPKSFVNIGLVIALIVGVFFLLSKKPADNASTNTLAISPTLTVNPDTLPGIQTGNYPWPPEQDHLRERLQQINLPALKEEGSTLHTHQHLDIYINGESISIPTDIGINEPQKFISPIHVHDDTGIIHIESPEVRVFTLGQFFDVWGVKFTNNCLGGYCTAGDKQLSLFVNGQSYTADFRSMPLEQQQEIVVIYGNSANNPSPIPAKFDFPPEY